MLKKDYLIIQNSDNAKQLKNLITQQSNITSMTLYITWLTIDAIKLVCDFLTSDNCKINDLRLKKFPNVPETKLIMDAISKNKTLTYIDFWYGRGSILQNNYTYDDFSADTVITKLAKALHHHPKIKHLNLSYNDMHMSLYDVLRYKPPTLTHLALSGIERLNNDDITYLLRNTSLQYLDIQDINFDIESSGFDVEDFKYNTSLLQLYYRPQGNNRYRQKIQKAVSEMLVSNRRASTASRKAALSLLSIRIFRRNKSGSFGYIPKEIVNIIARNIFESYIDDEWRQ